MTDDHQGAPNVLYRFFSATGQLLYVGITMNPPARFRAHSASKEWWAEVANITVESFSDREHLADAERLAIKTEQPEYNVIHNNGHRYDCAQCGRQLAKSATHIVIEAGAVICANCVNTKGKIAHGRFYPDCKNNWHDLNDHKMSFARYSSTERALAKVSADPAVSGGDLSDISETNPVGLTDYDIEQWALVPNWQQLAQLVNEIANTANRYGVCGNQDDLAYALSRLARGIAYMDCCRSCDRHDATANAPIIDTSAAPYRVDIDRDTGWMTGRYACSRGHHWKCHYLVNSGLVSSIA